MIPGYWAGGYARTLAKSRSMVQDLGALSREILIDLSFR